MVSSNNLIEVLIAHRSIAIAAAALWAFVSLCLIARLWVFHRRAGTISKLVWSIVLLIPLFGWLFFAAFHRVPEALSWTGHAEHGRDAPYAGSGGGPL
jgi:uncharacterized membrane protein